MKTRHSGQHTRDCYSVFYSGFAAVLLNVCMALCAVAETTDGVLRIETEVFVGSQKEPVAHSLTLFANGVAWDFLAHPDEIALHDPARERVVLIDPERNVKTEITTLRLERLSVSLASWARKADDRLVRWAGGPDFGNDIQETNETIELSGPRARYLVAFEQAPSAESAGASRRYADTALLVRALVHPGGLPPFPRLAINRRVATAGGIPSEVTLEVDPKVAMLLGRPDVMRSVHKIHPRLLESDYKRIKNAETRIGVAKSVDLAEFATPPESSETNTDPAEKVAPSETASYKKAITADSSRGSSHSDEANDLDE